MSTCFLLRLYLCYITHQSIYVSLNCLLPPGTIFTTQTGCHEHGRQTFLEGCAVQFCRGLSAGTLPPAELAKLSKEGLLSLCWKSCPESTDVCFPCSAWSEGPSTLRSFLPKGPTPDISSFPEENCIFDPPNQEKMDLDAVAFSRLLWKSAHAEHFFVLICVTTSLWFCKAWNNGLGTFSGFQDMVLFLWILQQKIGPYSAVFLLDVSMVGYFLTLRPNEDFRNKCFGQIWGKEWGRSRQNGWVTFFNDFPFLVVSFANNWVTSR